MTTFPLSGAIYLQDLATGASDGFLSDHNRNAISTGGELVGSNKRTVNGTLRSYTVATKKAFDIKWDLLPADATHTVDGAKGANDVLNFYEAYFNKTFYLYLFNRIQANRVGSWTAANPNPQLLTATTGDLALVTAAGERYTVQFSDQPDYEIVKRGVRTSLALPITDFWNISISLVEV